MEKEIRMFTEPLEARNDEQHGNVIEGVPIVFDKETDLGFYREVIDPRALDQADLKDVRLLVNHDTNQLPLARSRNNNENSTMQMVVREDGLHIRADLDVENNPRAAEVLSVVKRGDATGMSFAFTVDKDEWSDLETEMPLRRITGIRKVFEASVVTYPAYEATEVYARSLEGVKRTLESEREALESAKKLAALKKAIAERSDKLCAKK